MSPPTPFAAAANGSFVTGRVGRTADLREDEKRRVAEFCARRLASGQYPLAAYFPAVARLAESSADSRRTRGSRAA